MKNLILVLAVLVSGSAFASGKLVLEPRFMLNQERASPTAGLSIYEPLTKDRSLYLNSWTGIGEMPWIERGDIRWVTAKNTLEIPMFNWRFILGFGGQINYNLEDKGFTNSVHARLVVKLW